MGMRQIKFILFIIKAFIKSWLKAEYKKKVCIKILFKDKEKENYF